MIISIIRAIIVYVAVLTATRIMGKREIGNLTAFDLIIAIMIAELGVIPLQDNAIPLKNGLIPLAILAFLEIILAFLSLKSVSIRKILSGDATVIIEDGRILDDKMRKLRYNINDLLSQLRDKDVFNIEDVEYAILERSGSLSVLLKSQKKAVTPYDLKIETDYEGPSYELICDGKIQYINLKLIGITVSVLMEKLKEAGVEDIEEVFFASIDSQGGIYVSKRNQASRTDIA